MTTDEVDVDGEEGLGQRAESLSEEGKADVAALGSRLTEMETGVLSRIRSQPVLAVLGAVGLGFVAGRLASGFRRYGR